jgi:hypothetical protein
MNNTFELKRFNLVFKKLIFERSLMLYGSFILVALFTGYIYYATHEVYLDALSFQMNRMQAFAIGLSLGGIYWVSTGFNYFSNKEEGYNYLILPASYFEKWLSVMLLLGVFMLFYCLFFRILDMLFINYLRQHLVDPFISTDKMYFLYSAKPLSFWNDNTEMSLPFPNFTFLTFFNITALMAIGSLYFNKMALIKTLFASIGLYILLYYLSFIIGKILFQTPITSASFYFPRIVVNKTEELLLLPQPMLFYYSVFFSFILPIIFWLIALIRLREKEI